MSDFAVKIVKIGDVLPHPNADKLDLAQINGWQCVIQKGSYSVEDLVIYIPIDSVLPSNLESKLFGPDSKVKLSKSRVKSIKLRGAISQGMLCSLDVLPKTDSFSEGSDVTDILGVRKYEPPTAPVSMSSGKTVSKKKQNPNFKEYGGLNNFKNYPNLFESQEPVIITEKLHGTNWRAGYVPVVADTFVNNIKKLFGYLSKYEFVYGSNRTQLQNKVIFPKWCKIFLKWQPFKRFKKFGYYEDTVGNVYEEIVNKYEVRNKLKDGEVLYGEVIGDSIQKNYSYGCATGERRLVVFDLMIEGKYVDNDFLIKWCKERGFEHVPVLFEGPFDAELAKKLTVGNSIFCPSQKVIEGVVVRSLKETQSYAGRKVLKLISDEYLLKDNSDWH